MNTSILWTRFIKSSKEKYVLLFLLGILVSLMDVGYALILSWLTEFPFGEDSLGFLCLVAAGVCYILLQCFFVFLHDYCQRRFLEKTLLEYRTEIWEENFAMLVKSPDEVGKGLTKIIDETRLFSKKILVPLLGFPIQTFGILASLLVCFALNWAFGLLLLALSPILFLTIFIFGPIIGRKLNAYVDVFRGYQDSTLDLLNSKEIAFGYHRDGFFLTRAQDDSASLLMADLEIAKFDAPFEALSNVLSFGIRIMAMVAASLLIGLGTGEEWALPASLFAASALLDPLTQLAIGLNDFVSGQGLLNSLSFCPKKATSTSLSTFPGFRLVSAEPDNGAELHADLEVRLGEKALLLGDPGSGKSTAIKMLAGIIDSSAGSIQKPGVAGYCPQTPSIYSLNLATNVALSDDIDAGKLSEAKAFAKVNFDRDDCTTLSGGEQKRVGLARAYYHADGYLLLDEPATSIGKDGEKGIYQAILSYRGTVLASAHRVPFALLRKFDRIYVCSEHRLFEVKADNPLLNHYCLGADK